MSAMTNRPAPTTILSVTQDVAFSLHDLPLETLRREFGLLFDRAARALQKTGLDHDDVLFERRLVCRRGDQECDVPADWLADRDRLVQCVRSAFPDTTDLPSADGDVQIEALRVDVVVDRPG